MPAFDPYAVLGLERAATPDEVRAAYRRLAKERHPDQGGSAEAFAELGLAHNILMDDARRQAFDRDGKVTEDKPDNRRAAALQLLEAFFVGEAMVYCQSFEPMLDPRRRDLIAQFREKTNGEISEQTAEIERTRKAIAFLADFQKRFAGRDEGRPIERAIERRIAMAKTVMESMSEQIDHRVAALAIVGGYTFRSDTAGTPYEFFQLMGARSTA